VLGLLGEPTIISGLLVDQVQAVPKTSLTVNLLILGIIGAFSALKHSQKSRY
jgi:hypothetical protein